jgi:uncharacterized protein YndB with AHSA1/START domain
VTDALLVRAPVGLVYRTLTDVDGWPSWWPGCTTTLHGVRGTSATMSAGDQHAVELRSGRRRLRLEVTAHSWRHDAGFVVDVAGDVELQGEWWLAPDPSGVIVHHVVRDLAGRSHGTDRYRRAVNDGMQALKDRLELTVAVATGRVP